MSRLVPDERSPEAAEVARLIQRTLSGDSGAFEQIVIRYETRVLSLATRLLGVRDDAQDAAQEVFIRAYKYLHRLDPRKPPRSCAKPRGLPPAASALAMTSSACEPLDRDILTA
jgi:hypothetical protein